VPVEQATSSTAGNDFSEFAATRCTAMCHENPLQVPCPLKVPCTCCLQIAHGKQLAPLQKREKVLASTARTFSVTLIFNSRRLS
jgi:hypothetical protein